MPTLYVENVPSEIYSALRSRARQNRKSLAAEVISLLEENIVTTAELKARKKLLQAAAQLRARRVKSKTNFSSTEQMQREDRRR